MVSIRPFKTFSNFINRRCIFYTELNSSTKKVNLLCILHIKNWLLKEKLHYCSLPFITFDVSLWNISSSFHEDNARLANTAVVHSCYHAVCVIWFFLAQYQFYDECLESAHVIRDITSVRSIFVKHNKTSTIEYVDVAMSFTIVESRTWYKMNNLVGYFSLKCFPGRHLVVTLFTFATHVSTVQLLFVSM